MPSTSPQSVLFLLVALFAVFISYARPDLTYNTPQYSLLQNSEYDADVLVLGGSHAGLSGALTLTRHQHNIIIFDDGKPRNRWDTLMHVLPTWDHQTPNALRKASRAELRRTGLVSFVEERIVKIEKEHDALFWVTSAGGRKWSGRKLLLATGVEFAFPEIPGYIENFPEKILHCLFTRGFEFRGSARAGVIAADLASSPPHAVILGEDASKFAANVTIYTNGDPELALKITQILSQKGSHEVLVDARRITQISSMPGSSNITLKFDQGADKTESFIVHQPATKVNQHLVEQLHLETNGRGDIVTKMPFYQTNVSGVFAAGDSASPFKMIPNAIFQGSNAGAGIARELPRSMTGNEVYRVEQIPSWRKFISW